MILWATEGISKVWGILQTVETRLTRAIDIITAFGLHAEMWYFYK